MRKSLALFLAILALAALGGWGAYRWFGARPAPPAGRPPAPDASPIPASREDCVLACDRLRICRHDLAGGDCLDRCATEWDAEKAKCIQRAACRELDAACLLESEQISCAEACDRARECGFMTAADDCEPWCRADWDQDKRRCLLETPCEEIEAVCLPATAASPCGDFCARLAECGLIGAADDADCLDSCLAVDDPQLRDCAARVSCDLIEMVCLASDFDPLCLDACGRLERCGALGEISPDFCPAVCMSAWDEATISCILSRGCEELGAVCLRQPDAICREVCRKLVDCEMESEVDDCAAICTTELPNETRECVLGSPCGEIDQTCFGAPPDICRTACEKVVACGYDEDAGACYEACQGNPDLQLIGCILAFPCELIGQNCLQ